MRACLLLIAFSASAAAFAQYPGAVAPPEDLKKGFDTISISDAKRILTFLATECDGRGTGQPGYEKASKFVANEFHKLGLKPLGDNGTYLQTADFVRWRYEPQKTELTVPDLAFHLSGRDLALRGTTPELKISGKPVWVKASGANINFGDTRFDGQIVFVETEPRNLAVLRQLQSRGAAAILRVVPAAEATWRTEMGTEMPRIALGPSGSISTSGGEKLRAALEKVKEPTVQIGDAEITPYNSNIEITGHQVVEKVKVGNVVAELPGSDPSLASEFIGVGGHLDHLGDVDGVVYPGADDDGSGSTAVIEIARALVANPKKPRRSIVLMTFFGEEKGLLGSRFLTDHPPVPLDKMVAELQMDMVGRDSDGAQNGDRNRVDVAADNIDTIRLVGSKRISTELDDDIQAENKYVGFKFKYDAEDVYTRSDHFNFASKGIPIAFLFDGFHPDYHRPTDTIEKIDWVKLTSAARLYYLTAHDVADKDAAPAKDVPKS